MSQQSPPVPTESELVRARHEVQSQIPDAVIDEYVKLLVHWEGSGWCRADLSMGIMVGLQIAQNRRQEGVDG